MSPRRHVSDFEVCRGYNPSHTFDEWQSGHAPLRGTSGTCSSKFARPSLTFRLRGGAALLSCVTCPLTGLFRASSRDHWGFAIDPESVIRTICSHYWARRVEGGLPFSMIRNNSTFVGVRISDSEASPGFSCVTSPT